MTFQIKQEKFEGPLELLLDLIEKEKLSISEVSLSRVADEYVRHVRSLEKIDPEALAEFLVVAAQLILIKSKSLLPNLELSREEEVSIEELEKRLAEYQRIRELAKELKKSEGRAIATREAYLGVEPVFYPPPKLTLAVLQSAFRAFLESIPKIEKLVEEKIKKIISLEEKVSQIRAFLEKRMAGAFSEITRGAKEKVEIIVSFLALLELARQRFLDLQQERPFEDISIKRTNHHGA